MGEQAITLAKAVGYSSAGTCEFLVDSKRNFYFLEMNTRLQVEHPISECITGVDVVQEMIRIAKGLPLRFSQKDIKIHGWALEARVYAEDPYKNFGLPSIGRLVSYKDPSPVADNIRCDSGIEEGSEISIYYDPMICKLITYGPDRTAALSTMTKALDNYVIRGVTNNISLLRDIITEKDFVNGNITTKYLQRVYPEGFKGKTLDKTQSNTLIGTAAVLYAKEIMRSRSFKNLEVQKPSGDGNQFNFIILRDKTPFDCQVTKKDHKFHITINGQDKFILNDTFQLNDEVLNLVLNDDQTLTLQMMSKEPSGRINLQYLGTKYSLHVFEKTTYEMYKYMPEKKQVDLSSKVISPMPGIVKSVAVEVGQLVNDGVEICVVEAMKMQNKLVATRTGKIKKINTKVGEQVEEGKVLVELE